jgi:hypothetical protein
MFYYSAHDTTLNGILLGLNLIDEKTHTWPPFAAHIRIEVWRECDNYIDKKPKYFIKFFYCDEVILNFIFKILNF